MLGSLLTDDYGPVRFVAARGLGRDPAMTHWLYDFVAPRAELAKAREGIEQRLEARGKPVASPGGSGGAQGVMLPDGKPDWEKLRSLLGQQDRRSITVSE